MGQDPGRHQAGQYGVLFDEGASLVQKGNAMKPRNEDMRAGYTRADFTSLERGKFHQEAVKGTAVALLDPAIAKAFPTSEAVNEALLGLLTLAQQTARIAAPAKRPARKRASA
jgi:hypothetical protein